MCVNTGCSSCNGNCGCTCTSCTNNNCNSCTSDPCNEQPCGCKFEVPFECVRYGGNELTCISLQAGETLEQFVQRLNDFLCNLSTAVDGDPGDSAYQIWLNLGNVGTEQDFIDSLAGQPIDHVSFTSSSLGGAAGQAGATDTYTVWGDVGETINLGTFVVYNGQDGTGTPAAKINFYAEQESDVHIKDEPVPNVYNFPTGYSGLSYTNTSGSTKDYIVHISYDTLLSQFNSSDISSQVDGAIIKTIAAVDSIQWESLGLTDAYGALYDGPTTIDVVNTVSTEQVLTTPGGNPVEFRFGSATIPRNVSFFKKVTLANNETVSLKFKTKDATTPSLLKKAQIFVNEL